MFSHSFTSPGKRTSSFLMSSQKAVLCKGFPLPFVCSPHPRASRIAGMYSHFSEPLRTLQVAQAKDWRSRQPQGRTHLRMYRETLQRPGHCCLHTSMPGHAEICRAYLGRFCQAGETQIYSSVFPQSLFPNCLQDKRHQTMPQPQLVVCTHSRSAAGGGTSRGMARETSRRALVAAVPPQLAAEGRLRPRTMTRPWPQLSSGRGKFTGPELIGTSALLVRGVIFGFCSEESMK